MNAIELLKADHKKVRELLSELESTTNRATSRRTQLLQQIERELSIHARIEEEVFYPAFREAGKKSDDDKLYFEALEEHRAVEDLVLPDLLKTDPSTDQFSGRAKVLKELVEHHAGEEEKEMFPRARKLLNAAQLRELGALMGEMKAELLPGPALKGSVKTAPGLLNSLLSAFEAPSSGKSREAAVSTPAARKRPSGKTTSRQPASAKAASTRAAPR